MSERDVFIIHGRDLYLRDQIFHFLRSLDLRPLEWAVLVSGLGQGSPYIGDILDYAFSQAQAALALFTPDDIAHLRSELQGPNEPQHEIEPNGQPRANVLFEAGMAMGRYPDRTILVELGKQRPFSDISGRYTVRLDNQPAKRQDLVNRLKNCGCPADTRGADWLHAGDFSSSY